MSQNQPFMHDLSGVFAAPVQAWADKTGLMNGSGVQGVLVGDLRVIDTLTLRVNGAAPDWVGSRVFESCEAQHTYYVRTDTPIADPLAELTVTHRVTPEAFELAFCLEHDLPEPLEAELEIEITTGAASMGQIKQGGEQGPRTPLMREGTWSLQAGHVRTTLEAEDAEISVEGPRTRIRFRGTLPARTRGEHTVRFLFEDQGAVVVGSQNHQGPLAAKAAKLMDLAGMHWDQPRLFAERALSDLDSLTLALKEDPSQPFLAAGAPWFFTMFGRDSLLAAELLLGIDQNMAASTLKALAVLQGQKSDVDTAEQPGKILHEVRSIPLSFTEGDRNTSLPPLYYGSIDSTPLWIRLLGRAWEAGLDDETVASLIPALLRALGWLRDFSDPDGDGFLEYFDESGHGLANQGWKDSGDSIRWPDGRIAEGPIALPEVQAYAYEAAWRAADILENFADVLAQVESAGDLPEHAQGHTPAFWREYAESMQTRFRERFWVEHPRGRFPALALDKHKEPVDSIASNMGHLLGTGILDDEERRLIVDHLMHPTMFTGYGIRTLSSENGAYWPTRYHAGSVWTHDTAVALHGMALLGFEEEASRLATGLFRMAKGFGWRTPELFSGKSLEETGGTPLPYPASCTPQAWSAASAVPILMVIGRAGGGEFAQMEAEDAALERLEAPNVAE